MQIIGAYELDNNKMFLSIYRILQILLNPKVTPINWEVSHTFCDRSKNKNLCQIEINNFTGKSCLTNGSERSYP
jgi:hypothetical protein